MSIATTRPSVDVVTLEVLRNGFIQICEEVTITMLKTAHSVIFTEGKDLSTAIFDRDARLIAQDMQGCPIHVAAMPQAVKAGIKRYGIDEMHPGDVFLVNDCYAGGTHLPDITVFAPVFFEDELVGFVGNRGHHTDVGGMAPGSMPGDATEMYQEGLIVPTVRIYEQGEPVRDVLAIIAANVRLPHNTEGDIAAQRAGVLTGSRRLQSMMGRYGKATVLGAVDQIIDYSERHMRAEIAKLPDGTYSFEDYMDTDGQGGGPVRIAVTVTKAGSDIAFDFAGSDAQVAGAVNCVMSVTVASVWIAMLMFTDPAIHPSDGAFAPVTVTAPLGSVVNPRPPASTVSGLTETCNRIIDLCLAALALGAPERGVAGETGTCNVHTLGGMHVTEDGSTEQWVAILNPKGGWGGMDAKDGWTCVQDPLSNCRNQPCESLEHNFPMIVRRFGLRTGSEGAGRHRGGFGLVRDIEMTGDCVISTCLDRSTIPPFGLFGGDDGSCNVMSIRRVGAAEWEPLASRRSNVALAAGDVVRIETAIGGGFGDPLEREADAVLEDVLDGYLADAGAAREVYGVVITPEGDLDRDATSALRSERAGHRIRREHPLPRVPRFVAAGTEAGS
ncbi:MAG: hyuB [Solirubrobacterales bacterium]|nr:hyuB [Solirubrobacterales bacterium]